MESVRELIHLIGSDRKLANVDRAIRELPFGDPAHDYSHALRVAMWTVRLSGDHASTGEAIAAGLCHDIVNVPKDSPGRSRASELSAVEAGQLLAGVGFEPSSIDAVVEAIRDHSYSRGVMPQTPLGRALQDADRLDALGAIGVMRNATTGAKLNAQYFDLLDPWATGRDLNDRAYSLDHYFIKLLRIPGQMCTAEGQEEAWRRVDTMRRFLDAIGREIGIPRPSKEI